MTEQEHKDIIKAQKQELFERRLAEQAKETLSQPESFVPVKSEIITGDDIDFSFL